MRHVLVAVDDSEASERAAEFVNRFFGALDVSITAVNIGDTAISWSPYAAAPGLVYPWPPVWGPMASPPAGDGAPADAAVDAGREAGESTSNRPACGPTMRSSSSVATWRRFSVGSPTSAVPISSWSAPATRAPSSS